MITPKAAIESLNEMQSQIIQGSNIFGEISFLIERLEREAVRFKWISTRKNKTKAIQILESDLSTQQLVDQEMSGLGYCGVDYKLELEE